MITGGLEEQKKGRKSITGRFGIEELKTVESTPTVKEREYQNCVFK